MLFMDLLLAVVILSKHSPSAELSFHGIDGGFDRAKWSRRGLVIQIDIWAIDQDVTGRSVPTLVHNGQRVIFHKRDIPVGGFTVNWPPGIQALVSDRMDNDIQWSPGRLYGPDWGDIFCLGWAP
jgi:hypothetical protein